MPDPRSLARRFPFFARTCPECGALVEREYVRAPSQQAHWRGVEADVCPECGWTEAAD